MTDEAQIVYFRMSDEDRQAYGGPEWGELDVDRLMDARAGWLERIERQAGSFPVERMLAELQTAWPSARAVRMAMWLGRKQTGDATLVREDGKPEMWDDFNPQVLKARLSSERPDQAEPDDGAEVVEPDPLPEAAGESPATT